MNIKGFYINRIFNDLKSRGFVLLSTLIVVSTVLFTVITIGQMKMYQRLQSTYYKKAQQAQEIELRAIKCLVDAQCIEDLEFELYNSQVVVHLLANECKIVVSGEHQFVATCRLDLELFTMKTYTYDANE